MADAGVIAVHGMGAAEPGYADELFALLRRRLGEPAGRVAFLRVYYKGALAPNEQAVWEMLTTQASLRYQSLRRFLLFGFGDAAGLENRKEDVDSVYEQAQAEIALTLLQAYRTNPRMPLVFVAHSLGCQVLSSYLYDAQKAAAGLPVAAGLWRNVDAWAERRLGRRLTADEQAFLGGATCTGLLTTGCNIPIFVAAHQRMHIIPIARPTPGFRWVNVYDPDDALGWPLQPLPGGYQELVEDRAINAGHGLLNLMLKSWNPWSHQAYWSDGQVVGVADLLLRQALAGQG